MGKQAKTVDDLKQVLAGHFNISVADIGNMELQGLPAKARKLGVYLAQQMDPNLSNSDLASAFGFKSAGHVSTLAAGVYKVHAAELGTRNEAQIDLMSDLHQIAQKAQIELP